MGGWQRRRLIQHLIVLLRIKNYDCRIIITKCSGGHTSCIVFIFSHIYPSHPPSYCLYLADVTSDIGKYHLPPSTPLLSTYPPPMPVFGSPPRNETLAPTSPSLPFPDPTVPLSSDPLSLTTAFANHYIQPQHSYHLLAPMSLLLYHRLVFLSATHRHDSNFLLWQSLIFPVGLA